MVQQRKQEILGKIDQLKMEHVVGIQTYLGMLKVSTGVSMYCYPGNRKD